MISAVVVVRFPFYGDFDFGERYPLRLFSPFSKDQRQENFLKLIFIWTEDARSLELTRGREIDSFPSSAYALLFRCLSFPCLHHLSSSARHNEDDRHARRDTINPYKHTSSDTQLPIDLRIKCPLFPNQVKVKGINREGTCHFTSTQHHNNEAQGTFAMDRLNFRPLLGFTPFPRIKNQQIWQWFWIWRSWGNGIRTKNCFECVN